VEDKDNFHHVPTKEGERRISSSKKIRHQRSPPELWKKKERGGNCKGAPKRQNKIKRLSFRPNNGTEGREDGRGDNGSTKKTLLPRGPTPLHNPEIAPQGSGGGGGMITVRMELSIKNKDGRTEDRR